MMYSSQELIPREMLNLGENSKLNERVEKFKEVWYLVSKSVCELREEGQNEGMERSCSLRKRGFLELKVRFHLQAVRSFLKWGGGKSG